MTEEPTQVLERLLVAAGLEPGAVVLGDGAPGSPPPPEDTWAVVRGGAQFVVGALGRGRFAPYEALWTLSDGMDLAIRLARTPLPSRASEPSADELAGGRATGDAVLGRTKARGGAVGPNGLAPGDLLDVIGAETGHHLYALGTPFPARSQPPSDVGAPYLALRVVRALPDGAGGSRGPVVRAARWRRDGRARPAGPVVRRPGLPRRPAGPLSPRTARPPGWRRRRRQPRRTPVTLPVRSRSTSTRSVAPRVQ